MSGLAWIYVGKLARTLRRHLLVFFYSVVLGVVAGLVWTGMHAWDINVQVYPRGQGDLIARMNALEKMVSQRHVAIGIAPPAFTAIEYGDALLESLVYKCLWCI